MDKSISCKTLGLWARVKAVFTGGVVSADVCTIVKAKVSVLSKEVRDLTDDLEKSKKEVTSMIGLRDIDARKYRELVDMATSMEDTLTHQDFEHGVTKSERDSYRTELVSLTAANTKLVKQLSVAQEQLVALPAAITEKVMSASNSKKLDCPKIKQARVDITSGKTNLTDASIALGVSPSTLGRALSGKTYADCMESPVTTAPKLGEGRDGKLSGCKGEEPVSTDAPESVERVQLTCEGIQAVRDGLAKKTKTIEVYAAGYGISVGSLKKALACQTYKKCCKNKKKK